MSTLLPEEILSQSPSLRDGISKDVETRYRRFCCELIQEAGILLRLPQVVMATGQTLAHRFYYRTSLTKFDAMEVAMGSLFLAAKIEEKSRRNLIREFMRVFNYMYNERNGEPQRLLELGGRRYSEWKSYLLRTERYILKELGFNVYSIMDHPHKFILYYINCLFGSSEVAKFLAQKSWNFLNDSLRLPICVRYRPEVIACAAIYMSARKLSIALPESPPWWELFDADKKEIEDICRQLVDLYASPKVLWLKSLKAPKAERRENKEEKKRKVILKPGLNVMPKVSLAPKDATQNGSADCDSRPTADAASSTGSSFVTTTDPRAAVSSEAISQAVAAARKAAAEMNPRSN
eukprot:g1188.t1